MRRMAGVLSVGGVLLLASGESGLAQSWPPWAREVFGPNFRYEPRREAPDGRFPQERLSEGGARPTIAPMAPPVVPFPHGFQANSIVIDTGARKLYYVLADNRAYEYSIGVGREGFDWTGTEKISRKQDWPDWHPPPEMRVRDPRLPVKMTGGIRNPLGAMALYLGNSLYRIHGTNDPKSIGRAESSGCFRMLNSAVVHLASIAEIGTPVAVVGSLSTQSREVRRAPDAASQPAAVSQPKTLVPATADDVAKGAPAAPDERSARDYSLQAR